MSINKENINDKLKSITMVGIGILSTFGGMYIHKRLIKRVKNTELVTPNMIKNQIVIKGVVTRYVYNPILN